VSKETDIIGRDALRSFRNHLLEDGQPIRCEDGISAGRQEASWRIRSADMSTANKNSDDGLYDHEKCMFAGRGDIAVPHARRTQIEVSSNAENEADLVN
jgi:hypothetical protein